MKALSVIELAELYGMNRQSIYKRINKGDLSKNSDGKIDLSEAIRVFGEPSDKNKNVTTLQSTTVQKETEVDMLKQQLDILKKQLDLAHEREIFQREQLEAKDNQIITEKNHSVALCSVRPTQIQTSRKTRNNILTSKQNVIHHKRQRRKQQQSRNNKKTETKYQQSHHKNSRTERWHKILSQKIFQIIKVESFSRNIFHHIIIYLLR